jgi:hypothetical protein
VQRNRRVHSGGAKRWNTDRHGGSRHEDDRDDGKRQHVSGADASLGPLRERRRSIRGLPETVVTYRFVTESGRGVRRSLISGISSRASTRMQRLAQAPKLRDPYGRIGRCPRRATFHSVAPLVQLAHRQWRKRLWTTRCNACLQDMTARPARRLQRVLVSLSGESSLSLSASRISAAAFGRSLDFREPAPLARIGVIGCNGERNDALA